MSRIYTWPGMGLQVYKEDALWIVQQAQGDRWWSVNQLGAIFNKDLRPVKREGQVGQRVLAAINARIAAWGEE